MLTLIDPDQRFQLRIHHNGDWSGDAIVQCHDGRHPSRVARDGTPAERYETLDAQALVHGRETVYERTRFLLPYAVRMRAVALAAQDYGRFLECERRLDAPTG